MTSQNASQQEARHISWSTVPLEPLTPQISRQVVTGERAMAGMIFLKKGAYVPKHSHESEQLTIVFEGALRFLIGGKEIDVKAGEVLVIPSWLEHEATALEDTREMDVFSPIRHDWLDGTDTYFQAGVKK